MFGFKWYKPREAIRRSIMDQMLYDLNRLNITKFKSVYSSDMSMMKWDVLYPNILSYTEHLMKATRALKHKIELNPYDYSKVVTTVYVSDFSLGHKKEYLDIEYTYKILISQLVEFITLYNQYQKDDDSIREYNVRILSKLIDNIVTLITQLSLYPE